MRTIHQEIPQEQKDILDNALKVMQQALLITKNKDSHLNFDIDTLRALLKYKIEVVLTDVEFDNFTSDNGVDFPEYIFKK